MKVDVFWIIIGVLITLFTFNAEAGTLFDVPSNIVENSSAEELLIDRPDKWKVYTGGGAFTFDYTDEEAHSGDCSACLTVIGFGDNNALNAAIIVANADGYNGAEAYECEENTKYFYAFYAKAEEADDFKDPLRVLLWCWKKGGGSGDRVFPAPAKATLTSEWTRYEGTFTTPAGAKTFALGIGPNGTKVAELEATFYLDDVYLGLTPPPPDPQAVDASDKLVATWGKIKFY